MRNQHIYTEEEKQFFTEYVAGHSHKEIQTEFTKRFNWAISENQIKCCITRYKLNTGITGYFEKGFTPYNKGKKGQCAKGCEKGWFKKGNIPINHRELGSERLSKDGYIEIKVEEPNKWKFKHIYLWEQENGKLPKGYCVVFKDQNKMNLSLDNLQLISRQELLEMNKNNMFSVNPEITEVGINTAKILTRIKEIRKEQRNAEN